MAIIQGAMNSTTPRARMLHEMGQVNIPASNLHGPPAGASGSGGSDDPVMSGAVKAPQPVRPVEAACSQAGPAGSVPKGGAVKKKVQEWEEKQRAQEDDAFVKVPTPPPSSPSSSSDCEFAPARNDEEQAAMAKEAQPGIGSMDGLCG